jgi:predicted SnoaL-like aldol condensation-catalyzing enzyme
LIFIPNGRWWCRDRRSIVTAVPRRLDIRRVIAEGDMVVTHSHLDLEPGNPDNPGRALADFFLLEDGKVVEHWDVIQEVPKTAANDNGMF